MLQEVKMAEKLKPLKDLKGSYGSQDISQLVDFTKGAGINLPESEVYFFEKKGNTVHIHGTSSGISEYELPNYSGTVKVTSSGIELGYKFGGVEKVVLHTKPYSGNLAKRTRIRTRATEGSDSSESRSGEGISGTRYGSGESGSGES
jgi:hypothetical protein